MTTTEHLQKIKAKCEQLIRMWETSSSLTYSVAGWRATIVAIDGLLEDSRWIDESVLTTNILAAWPEELL